jgi:glutamate-ammonia-ligase adenylyltransferase
VLGLGRLGSRELTADSDLDLVVLYDFDEGRRDSSGPRKLDAVVYYTRLTQRLVAALTAPTRRGRLYEVDLRLRPEGGKAPLATQFKGFVSYQQKEAELWEHMALTRARVLAGEEAFGREVAGAIAMIIAQPRQVPEVAREVRAMRDLIAKEKGDENPWDLKLAAGGLTDLDFLAQALTLAYAHKHPALVGLAPGPSLRESASLGLLSPAEAAALGEAHALFTNIHQWQRLAIAGPFDAATVAPANLKRLASVVSLPSAKVLLNHLDETRHRVRETFNRVLDEICDSGREATLTFQWIVSPAVSALVVGPRGRWTSTIVPIPCCERMRKLPPCSSASERAMARPRPEPL